MPPGVLCHGLREGVSEHRKSLQTAGKIKKNIYSKRNGDWDFPNVPEVPLTSCRVWHRGLDKSLVAASAGVKVWGSVSQLQLDRDL